MRLLLLRLSALELRKPLFALGVQDDDLLLRREEACLIALQLRACLTADRFRLLGALYGAGAGLEQFAIALGIGVGEGQRCLGGRDGRAGLRNESILQHDLRVEIADRRPGCVDTRLRLGKCGPEIAVVDPGEHLSCGDMFIVAHHDIIDVAGDLRGDDGRVGLYIGVVGGFQVAPMGDVVVAVVSRGGCTCQQGKG